MEDCQAQPKLVSLQVGTPRRMDWQGKPWRSAIYKAPVRERLFLGETNLAGDRQANTLYHGGPDKAVCCFASEHYPYWREALGVGEAFGYGAFGENFTLAGLTEEAVCIGDVFAVGMARVQVSQPRQPCVNLARKWACEAMPERMIKRGQTGFYLRVLQPGEVGVGDMLTLLERPYPHVSITTANAARYTHAGGADMEALLAALPALSESWRRTFRQRLRQSGR